jgi:hypothetical protein
MVSTVPINFGSFRDREVIFPLNIDGNNSESFDSLCKKIAVWVSKVVDVLTKETFTGYNNAVDEVDCRIFMCSNVLLNFH